MSSIDYEDTKCLCGKDKLSSNINDVNWLRHIKSCDVRKRRHKNCDISTFFTKLSKKTCKEEIGPNLNIVSTLSTTDDKSNTDTNVIDELNYVNECNVKNTQVTKYSDDVENANMVIYEEPIVPATCLPVPVLQNDPALWPKSLSSKLIHHFSLQGPCQPLPSELKDCTFPNTIINSKGHVRSFHESYYKKLGDGKFANRTWISYSISLNRYYCYTCKLFGLPRAKQNYLAIHGSNDYKNISRNITQHEVSPEHIQSEIARGLYMNHKRIDINLLESKNRQVAEKP
ncbi:zinc finger MYM-type protein 5-like [Myzus persicae]|uniref:zinc finger MYM-type protein 5-like n=1 Tax=Myzus persicae TaxID=13164 RepID=UPI000B9327BA|nr:zinc finger MYM-type protein 5-like [Myzus persicae]